MANFSESNTSISVLDGTNLGGEDIFVLVLKCLMYIFGTLGNLLIIFMILFLKEYNRASHWYVLQLALADLLFLQTLPFKMSEIIQRTWIYSTWFCKAIQTVLFLNYYGSILFLTVMAVDRYVAVCNAMSAITRRMRSPRTLYSIAGIIWIVSLALCIPTIMFTDRVGIQPHCVCTFNFPKDPVAWCKQNLYSGEELNDCVVDIFPAHHAQTCVFLSSEENTTASNITGIDISDYDWFDLGSGDLFGGLFNDEPEESGQLNSNFLNSSKSSEEVLSIHTNCMYDGVRPGWNAFIYFNASVMFFLPLIIIIVCYSLIVFRVTHRNVGDRENSVASQAKVRRDKQDRNRVTLVCAMLVMVFTVCWLPFHSVHLAKLFGIRTGGGELCVGLETTISILAYLNSACNPFVYSFFGKNFRERMRKVATHRRMKRFISAMGFAKSTTTTSQTTTGRRPSSSSAARHDTNNLATLGLPKENGIENTQV